MPLPERVICLLLEPTELADGSSHQKAAAIIEVVEKTKHFRYASPIFSMFMSYTHHGTVWQLHRDDKALIHELRENRGVFTKNSKCDMIKSLNGQI